MSFLAEQQRRLEKEEKQRRVMSDDYNMDEFNHDLSRFGIKDTDYENQGLNALYLLMRGKFIGELTALLQEESTPKSVKLLICNFMIRGRYFETHEIVQKTLVTVFHTNLDEWKKAQEKEEARTTV